MKPCLDLRTAFVSEPSIRCMSNANGELPNRQPQRF